MKKIVALFAFILVIPAHATTYRVKGVSPYLRDGVFKLINNSKDSIVLDCSSFLHNLTITSNGAEKIYYLSTQECEDVFMFYRKRTLRRKCLTKGPEDFKYHFCRYI